MINRTWIWAWLRLRALARDERGANMVEYALVIALAILVIFVAIRNFSDAFVEATEFISDQLGDAVNPT